MLCIHEWIDIAGLGSFLKKSVCSKCGEIKTQKFDVTITGEIENIEELLSDGFKSDHFEKEWKCH